MPSPDYRAAIAPCFDRTEPLHGILKDLPMDTYRDMPGIAPSDLKMGIEDLRWGMGGRGHLLRIAVDKLRREHEAGADPIPVWLGGERKKSDAFALGTLYHTQLLTPDTFKDEFAVLDKDLIESFLRKSRERKLAKAPSKFSWQLKEAQQWKKDHPGQEPNDLEKAQLLSAAQERIVGSVKFHANLTEFEAWKIEQEQAGRTVVTSENLEIVDRMMDALFSMPANSQTGEYLNTLDRSPDRMENSLFANTLPQSGSHEEPLPAIQLKGRPDWLPGDGLVLDPKTCASCHPIAFGNDVERYGYDISMAGYTVLSDALLEDPDAFRYGFPLNRVAFLAQEKTAPFLARVWELPDDWLQAARRRFRNEVARLCRAYRDNDWNGIEMQDGVQTLLPSKWKAAEIEMAC